MRDDTALWDTPRNPAAPINLGPAKLTPVHLARQTLVSGPNVLTQTDLPLVDWPGAAPADAYAVTLRRDRLLLVNAPETPDGWNEATRQASSDVTDAYTVFDLTGDALPLLRRGAEITPDIPSRSTARLLFGLGVFLYRMEDAKTYRLHVPRAHAEGLVTHFEKAASHLNSGARAPGPVLGPLTMRS
ncbi:hypothetical protein [Roseovarius indicus]|uniref:hypothetical protein n=1 Tax=Roseovarius indicus TaxID=540747 RepID=UPI0032EB3198